jgi:glycosyltransferase involved in cell wall biosynthesis
MSKKTSTGNIKKFADLFKKILLLLKDLEIISIAFSVSLINTIKRKQNKKSKSRKRKINVLFSISNLLIGGAQQSVKNFALSLNKEKFNVFVCSTTAYPDKSDSEPLSGEIERGGVKIFNPNLTGFRKSSEKQKFIKILKENKIDILHSMLDPFDRWGSVYAKEAGVPVTIIKKASTYLLDNSFEARITNRIIDRYFVDKFISVSESMSEYLVKYECVNTEKISFIPNPVDTEYFTPERGDRLNTRKELGFISGTIVVGNITRFEARKGIEYFLRTAAELCKQNLNVKFLLAGEGKEESRLKNLASVLNIEKEVLFIKSRRNIIDLLSAIDIFLFTSISGEGLSNAMLEAMATAKPIVASNVGSNYELITDNVSGLLPTPDSWALSVNSLDVKRLSSAVAKLIDNSDLRKKFGNAAREKVLKFFSSEIIAKKLEDLYIELLNRQ